LIVDRKKAGQRAESLLSFVKREAFRFDADEFGNRLS